MELFDSSTADSVIICTKGFAMLSKEIAAAERAKTDEEQLKRYKDVLSHAKMLRAEAAKIPPDNWTDHFLRLMKVNIGDIANYARAAIVEKDLKDMTRNDTVDNIDVIIKAIEVRIKRLEKNIKRK